MLRPFPFPITTLLNTTLGSLGLLRASIRAIITSLYLLEINKELKGKDNYPISLILATVNSTTYLYIS
jgi:hypothetical protein